MIHVVTGHICSGKTTYVRERAAPGDVVVDLDRIALSIAPEGTAAYAYDQRHRDVARRIWWYAIDEAVRQHRRPGGFDLWIVHAYPSDEDVARYRRLGASIAEMGGDRETLVARARAERPPEWIASLVSALDARSPEAL